MSTAHPCRHICFPNLVDGDGMVRLGRDGACAPGPPVKLLITQFATPDKITQCYESKIDMLLCTRRETWHGLQYKLLLL
jgi:hypothetical protein